MIRPDLHLLCPIFYELQSAWNEQVLAPSGHLFSLDYRTGTNFAARGRVEGRRGGTAVEMLLLRRSLSLTILLLACLFHLCQTKSKRKSSAKGTWEGEQASGSGYTLDLASRADPIRFASTTLTTVGAVTDLGDSKEGRIGSSSSTAPSGAATIRGMEGLGRRESDEKAVVLGWQEQAGAAAAEAVFVRMEREKEREVAATTQREREKTVDNERVMAAEKNTDFGLGILHNGKAGEGHEEERWVQEGDRKPLLSEGVLSLFVRMLLRGDHVSLDFSCVSPLTSNDVLLLLIALFVSGASWFLVITTDPESKLIYLHTERNKKIVAGCPNLLRGFRPIPPLTSGHIQTGSVLSREGPSIIYDREMLSTGDGGYISLDWLSRTSGNTCPHMPARRAREQQTILVLLHGLTGGSQEAYVRGIAETASKRAGMRVVVINNRGCAGQTLFTPQAYSAAWTADVRIAIKHVAARWPDAPMFALGYSLGANILGKYLGEEGDRVPLVGACVVSNPYNLLHSNEMMRKGLGPFYDRVLAKGLVRVFAAHRDVLERRPDLPRWDRVAASKSVWEFDDRHTRRSFGYESVEQYYSEGSSARRLAEVTVPLLFLVAQDDHMLDVRAMDFDRMTTSNPNVIVAVTKRGGHVAWHEQLDRRGEQWADYAAVQFFVSVLNVHRGLP